MEQEWPWSPLWLMIDTSVVNLYFSSPFLSAQPGDVAFSSASFAPTIFLDSDGSDGNITVQTVPNILPIDFTTPAKITSTVRDKDNNLACGRVSLTNTDHTAPTVVSVTTADADLNAKIDNLLFNCSENIDELTLRVADFTVSGYKVVNVTGSKASRYFRVWVEEIVNGTDANATPTVSFTKGSLQDRYGNKMEAINNMQSVDRIGPQIISAVGVGSSLKLTFSKPAFNATQGSIAVGDVTYYPDASNTKGQNGLNTIVDADGSDSVITFTMVREFVKEDFSADTIGGKASIVDVNGNPLNATARTPITIGVAPEPTSDNGGLPQEAIIGIAAGGGGLLLIVIAAVLFVVCKKRGCCNRDKAAVDQNQITNEFDFAGTEMTQSSRGVARLEA